MTKTAETPKKKGTVKTESIVGTGLSKMASATKQLVEATLQFEKLGELVQQNSLQIADQEQKIAELGVQFEETKRQKTIDLDLLMKEQGLAAASRIYAEQGKVAIDKDEYESLKLKAFRNEEELKKTVDEAVAAATSAMKRSHEAELKLKDAEFKAAQADDKAQLKNAAEQVTLLTAQVKSWQEQLTDERKASTERAKASAIGSVNLAPAGR